MRLTPSKQTQIFGLFWVCYFLYEWLGNGTISCEYRRYFINAMVVVPLAFLATWFTINILIKRYYLKGHHTRFWIGLVASFIIFAIARRSFNYYYTYPLYWPEANQSFFFVPKLLIEGVGTYLIVALFTMFYFVQAWNKQQRVTAALQRDKVEAQLEMLKSQVQPHFIFNTLNNIYSLSVRNNERSADQIYRLSSLLSYMLYDSRQQVIPASKELEYIRNYIELEKIRHSDRLDVSINMFTPVDNFYLSPFLLVPLVENCFKHGVNNHTEKSWIRMDFSVQEEWMTVKIENNYTQSEPSTNTQWRNGNNGIGLENVRKRLEILYPRHHEFRLMNDGQSFLAIMKLKNLARENTMPDSR